MSEEMDPPARGPHKVLSFDVDAQTGVCAICGDVRVQIRRRTNGNKPIRAVCLVSRREDRQKRQPAVRAAKYSISAEQFDSMHRGQGSVCAICEQPGERLVIDHDHASGAVRALLCNGCNRGLGFFKEDPTRMISAALYLQAFGKGQPTTARRTRKARYS